MSHADPHIKSTPEWSRENIQRHEKILCAIQSDHQKACDGMTHDQYTHAVMAVKEEIHREVKIHNYTFPNNQL